MQTKTILTSVLSGLLSLMALSCGTVESTGSSGSAPAIKNGNYGEVSPFDTLAVQFTTSVDSIATSQISSKLSLALKNSSTNGWILFGDSTFATGIAMLVPDTDYSVTIQNLKGTNGKTQSNDQRISFHTMAFLDHDGQKNSSGVLIDNDQYGRAEVLADSVKFFDGTTLLTEGKSIAGIIAGGMNGLIDNQDWFSFYARRGDSLNFTLSNLHGNLDLDFRGPESPSGVLYDTVVTSAKSGTTDEHLGIRISADRVLYGLTNTQPTGMYLKYWVRVYASKDFSGRSSYVLTLKNVVTN